MQISFTANGNDGRRYYILHMFTFTVSQIFDLEVPKRFLDSICIFHFVVLLHPIAFRMKYYLHPFACIYSSCILWQSKYETLQWMAIGQCHGGFWFNGISISTVHAWCLLVNLISGEFNYIADTDTVIADWICLWETTRIIIRLKWYLLWGSW